MNTEELKLQGFTGDIHDSHTYKLLYATDASIYRELPSGVVFPKNANDIQILIRFASKTGQSIIPRGAGTSLAGQCVGNGIVMDVSRYMNEVVSIDLETKSAWVQPGLVRDELNRQLSETSLIFGPNTSTSNRATVGGMVGNNSSGTTSVAFGVTRDKVLELEVILADGTICRVDKNGIEADEDKDSVILTNLQTYFDLFFNNNELHDEIARQFPLEEIHRRNTGYALDLLLRDSGADRPNWLNVICGSEGTICAISKIKLKLDTKPLKHGVLLTSHFSSLDGALRHVPLILSLDKIYALELMDDVILDCARSNTPLKSKMHFVEGQPRALLITEIRSKSESELSTLIAEFKQLNSQNSDLYHTSETYGSQMKDVWYVRKAGLGILANIPGAAKALACIEDTAVKPDQLANYIQEFEDLMKVFGQKVVYYAHAGAGELHLRPVLNLRAETDREDFRKICTASAKLIKRYRGSLSGEHGDGRVRAPFLKEYYGEIIYGEFLKLKKTFDPDFIFNPGKIVEAKDILENLRYDLPTPDKRADIQYFNYEPDATILHYTERCNGSGDCRKSHALSPGMCPTYQATGKEIHSTRARANLMREAVANRNESNLLSIKNLDESLSSCLSCKACAIECPSTVDVAILKAEYLYQRRKQGYKSWRDRLLANPAKLYRLNKFIPFSRTLVNSSVGKYVLSAIGLTHNRSLPMPVKRPLRQLLSKYNAKPAQSTQKKITLAIDEFVNYFDVAAGIACYEVLIHFGYEIRLWYYDSGRAFMSKGYLKEAEKVAQHNVSEIEKELKHSFAIVGIEPSAIFSFRDEYKRFPFMKDRTGYENILSRIRSFEEFLLDEMIAGELDLSDYSFHNDVRVLCHLHCHQRALSTNYQATSQLFNAISGWICNIINTGCCGMAGGFGYEKEHYELSMQVANLGLFPEIRNNPQVALVAAGMSCRHQIRDGVQRKAMHPAQVLMKYLIK